MDKKIIYWMLVLISLVSWGYATTDVSSIRDIWLGENIYEDGVKGYIVPAGAIAIFEGACPVGWTNLSESGEDFNGVFIRGDEVASVLGTGGSSTHSHTTTGSTADESGHIHSINFGNVVTTGSNTAHTHTYSDTVSSTTDAGSAHSHGSSYTRESHLHGHGTYDIDHVHSVNIGSYAPGATSCNTKQEASGTARTGCHTHTFDPAASNTGAASIDVDGSTQEAGGGSITGTSATESSHTHGLVDYTVGGTSPSGQGEHTHSEDFPSYDLGTGTAHSHGAGSIVGENADNEPSYVNLIFCLKD